MFKQQIIKFKIEVIDKCTPKGSKTYIVGGVPRDILDDREINDIDITTSNKAGLMENLSKFCEENNLKHKVHEMKRATIFTMGVPEDCAKCEYGDTNIIDIEISDYQDNEEVNGGDRDFRCNALHWECGEGTTSKDNEITLDTFKYPLVPVGSMYLWDEHVLYPVHIHSIRINPVRIFRAADMISRILPYRPSCALYNQVSNVMAEIRTESANGKNFSGVTEACLGILHKIFHDLVTGQREWINVRNALSFLAETGALYLIHPDLYWTTKLMHKSSYHNDSVWHHTMDVLNNIDIIWNTQNHLWVKFDDNIKEDLLWAALLHDIGKVRCVSTDRYNPDVNHFYEHHTVGAEIAEGILKLSPLGPADKNIVLKLIKHHMVTKQFHDERPKGKHMRILRKLMYDLGDEVILDQWIILNTADCWASLRHNREFPAQKQTIEAIWEILISIDNKLEPDWFRYKAPVTGDEIRDVFHCEPRMIGAYLEQLRDVHMSNPNEIKSKEDAIHYLKTLGGEWKKKVMGE